VVRSANGKHTRSGRTTIPAVPVSCCGTPGALGADGALYDELPLLGKLGSLGAGRTAEQPKPRDESRGGEEGEAHGREATPISRPARRPGCLALVNGTARGGLSGFLSSVDCLVRA
jgi:hypothetical protein